MSASEEEVRQVAQDLADRLLELLGSRMAAGQVVLNINESRVQSVDLKTHHRMGQTNGEATFPGAHRFPLTR
jgi:hypothetical protein